MTVTRNNTNAGLVGTIFALAIGAFFERPGQNELCQKLGANDDGTFTIKNYSTGQVDAAVDGSIETVTVGVTQVQGVPSLNTFGELGIGEEFERRGVIGVCVKASATSLIVQASGEVVTDVDANSNVYRVTNVDYTYDP